MKHVLFLIATSIIVPLLSGCPLFTKDPEPEPTDHLTPSPSPVQTFYPTPGLTPDLTPEPTLYSTPGPLPGNPATGVFFGEDRDDSPGEIGGDITITRAIDETDLTQYVLYWGPDSETKIDPALCTLEKTGSDIIYNIPLNTIIPENITHFHVYTRNRNGEMTTGVSTPFIDITRHLYTGPGDEVFHLINPGITAINYELDLGAYMRDVYFIFTNTSISPCSYPTIAGMESKQNETDDVSKKNVSTRVGNAPVIIRGKPEIDEFNKNSYKYLKHGPAEGIAEPEPLRSDAVEDKYDFMYNSTSSLIPSTCRKVISDGTKTLTIWVADDCWKGAGVKAREMTQEMVDEITDRFMIQGTNNDIYDWVTNIYGPEWGDHAYPTYLIKADNKITILLYDIDDDNSVEGGVSGFFWAKDNWRVTEMSYSNERIMFYIDAVLFAVEDDDEWEVTDSRPSALIGTLAHELQHMIHYYQKPVLRTNLSGSDVWLNEMCSEVTEDFIALKLGIDGPRGVAYSDGTGGSARIYEGRLPRYNYFNGISLTTWGNIDIQASYSITYAFGAYCARNFNGVQLFKDIVRSNFLDRTAITSAFILNGYEETFETAMIKWAAANLLSDTTIAPPGYRYNGGNYFSYSINGISYDIGSINLYNYYYSIENHDGPYIHTESPVGEWGSHLETSNLFYRAGSDLTGIVSRNITLGREVAVTIVVKNKQPE